jgi:hypothetical protein
MKKRMPRQTAVRVKRAISKSTCTGDHCPTTGWWAPATKPEDSHFISEGNLMPSQSGQAGRWVFLSHELDTIQRPKYDHVPPGLLSQD